MGFRDPTVMITSLTCLSPAKLNLFLHITGRRADGRHNLQTVFQLLDWGDAMRFERKFLFSIERLLISYAWQQ